MAEREQVWAITMVKNEADIIGFTLRHLLAQNIDGIIVADNLSTDQTRNVLLNVRRGARIPVLIVDDREVAYYQSAKMTALARQAAQLGASWIIPFDADELWYAKQSTIGDALRSQPLDIQAIHVQRWNHISTTVDPIVKNPYQRMKYREPLPIHQKCAFRFRPEFRIGYGNHGVRRKGQRIGLTRQDDIAIRHFPYRSLDQFIEKAVAGTEALNAAKLKKGLAGHWRKHAETMEREGRAGMQRVFESQFVKQSSELIYDPAPYRGN